MLRAIWLDASFDLANKKGISVAAKMRIVVSPISGSVDYVKEFMEKVDADVFRLPSNDTVASAASTPEQVLRLTKTVMDQLTQVRLL